MEPGRPGMAGKRLPARDAPASGGTTAAKSSRHSPSPLVGQDCVRVALQPGRSPLSDHRLRRDGPAAAPVIPSAERATPESLRQRLDDARHEIARLRAENSALHQQLARRLGEERSRRWSCVDDISTTQTCTSDASFSRQLEITGTLRAVENACYVDSGTT
jgi:hypothetical protein